jgi:hypothetical protein
MEVSGRGACRRLRQASSVKLEHTAVKEPTAVEEPTAARTNDDGHRGRGRVSRGGEPGSGGGSGWRALARAAWVGVESFVKVHLGP